MWTMQVPVISTSHISKSTAHLLQQPGILQVPVAPYEHGWFLYAPSSPEDVDFPEDLQDVVGWFREQPQFGDQFWVRLDADGTVIDGLPTYDW